MITRIIHLLKLVFLIACLSLSARAACTLTVSLAPNARKVLDNRVSQCSSWKLSYSSSGTSSLSISIQGANGPSGPWTILQGSAIATALSGSITGTGVPAYISVARAVSGTGLVSGTLTGQGIADFPSQGVITGAPSTWPTSFLPSAPGPTTLGGVKSGQCTTTTGKLMGFDTSGNRICEADQTGGPGGGIASLNLLSGSAQTFAKVDDTNVTLSIGSIGSTHTWTIGWAGLLAINRGGHGAATVPQNYIFAGPTSGTGPPSWRLAVPADIPGGLGSGITSMATGLADPVSPCTAPSASHIEFFTNTSTKELWACVGTGIWKKVVSTTNVGPYSISGLSGSLTSGTASLRPACTASSFYLASDTKALTSCDGTTWSSTLNTSGSIVCVFETTANTHLCFDSSGNRSASVKTDAGATTNQWISWIGPDGQVHRSQPSFANISGAAISAQLPLPAVGAGGKVEAKACPGTDKVSAIGTDGIPVCSADQSGTGTASLPSTTNLFAGDGAGGAVNTGIAPSSLKLTTDVTNTLTATVGTGGVTANLPCKLGSGTDAGKVVLISTTEGALGICRATVSAGGTVVVDVFGASSCVASGAWTQGNFVGTNCADLGQTARSSIATATNVLGKASVNCTGGSLCAIQLLTSYSSGTQAGGIGGVTPFYSYLPAAKCNQGVSGPAFSLPGASVPAANCGTTIYTGGTNRADAVLTFTATGQSVEDHFRLPPDQTGAVDLSIGFDSTSTSGNIVWNIATGCAAVGSLPDPTLGTADTFTAAAQGTALWLNVANKSGVNLNSCPAGSELFWRIGLDPTTTALVDASHFVNMISVQFTIRRTL